MNAIGGVSQAKVFVDLKEALLEGRRLEKCGSARAVSEEALRGDFHALVGEGGAQVLESDPALFIAGDGQGEEDIGEHVGDS